MKAKYNSICCKCNQKITKGEEISYLSNKYKIRGEEVCCDLGSKTEWVTNRRCVILSAGRFDVINIKPGITSETECILAGETQTKGACVINGNTCQILSILECGMNEDSDFEPNTLCSSSRIKYWL